MTERMKELVDILNLYAYHYYVLDNPVISDGEYDKLYDELTGLENFSGIILPDSPTKRIGGEPVKSFNSHEHINKLYSLDKCNTYEALTEWYNKLCTTLNQQPPLTLEYKLDGLTLCLTYDNGLFVGAATRGNGTAGEDVTAQVSTVKSIPRKIDYRGKIEVQGEGIMRLSAFVEYNKTAKEPLKNPRNGVAGAIRNLDPKVTAARNLDIIFYNINYIDNDTITSQSESIEFLRRNRFKTERIFNANNIDTIINEIQAVEKSALDFDIDGMVIKVDGFDARHELGFTDKFPRWAIAFKFEAEETTTILKEVVWQVGRTGKLTPLGMLEPVQLAGATVSKATLNNFGDIIRKNVKIGSRVFIRRSNDVIPEILGTVEDEIGEEILKPCVCPACGAELVENGAHIFCQNTDGCPPQVYGKIEHYASKDCMDIEGVSDKTVQQLYFKLGVKSVDMLYNLTADDLSNIDGFKNKKIMNFLKAVEDSKNRSLAQFINALGIPNIGRKTARDLAQIFGSIDGLMNSSKEELLAINEIGEIMADSIITFFELNRNLISQLKACGIDPKTEKTVSTDNYFSGKNVVLTGSMEMPRSKIAELIESKGGVIRSSVTKDTDIVVAGEDAGSKLDKAKSLNKKIINYAEFITLINT